MWSLEHDSLGMTYIVMCQAYRHDLLDHLEINRLSPAILHDSCTLPGNVFSLLFRKGEDTRQQRFWVVSTGGGGRVCRPRVGRVYCPSVSRILHIFGM